MNWFDLLNRWVATQLQSSNSVGAFAFLFLSGALASLLPCVYPLYPITVNILRMRKSPLGWYAHPLAYYIGLAFVFFMFGVIAAITGGAFNTVLRYPIANLAIGSLLFALALATVHLLEFPVLSADFGREDSRLAGTFAMGAGAGLLSSACVGPVVVSILIGFASNTTHFSAMATLLAALKMLAFGLGVGLPMMLIALAGLRLPKGGRWMVYVQWVFAVLIAYFSLGYFTKGLEGYGFAEAIVSRILLGGGLIVGAVYWMQSHEKQAHERMQRALFALAAVAGLLVLLQSTLSGVPASSAATQSATTDASQPMTEKHGELTWYLDKDAAFKAAKSAGKMVFADFHGDWCTNCKAFQQRIADDPKLREALGRAVLLKVYDGSDTFRAYQADSRFPELKIGLPFFVIADADGNVIYKTNDYTRTDDMQIVLTP
jgi:thiol:disulfide interchange protein DsbD